MSTSNSDSAFQPRLQAKASRKITELLETSGKAATIKRMTVAPALRLFSHRNGGP